MQWLDGKEGGGRGLMGMLVGERCRAGFESLDGERRGRGEDGWKVQSDGEVDGLQYGRRKETSWSVM